MPPENSKGVSAIPPYKLKFKAFKISFIDSFRLFRVEEYIVLRSGLNSSW
jgi:hypothetical protein